MTKRTANPTTKSKENTKRVYDDRIKLLETYGTPIPDYFIDEIMLDSLKNEKSNTLQENVDIFYYYGEFAKTSEFHEIIQPKIIELLKIEEINPVLILRLTRVKLDLWSQLKQYIIEKLGSIMSQINAFDLSSLYFSGIASNLPSLKELIYNELKSRVIPLNQISFQKFEKMLISFINSETSGKELWPIFENFTKTIISEPMVPDHMLLRVMQWFISMDLESSICDQIFVKRILEIDRLPIYHTKDNMNLAIIVCNYEPIRTPQMLEIADTKLFEGSHYMDYFEQANSLYNMTRINKIGFETQQLLFKRILDKELNPVLPNDFSLACYSATMLNHLEFCKKSITFAKIIMDFKNLGNEKMIIGEILKQQAQGFTVSITSIIRIS